MLSLVYTGYSLETYMTLRLKCSVHLVKAVLAFLLTLPVFAASAQSLSCPPSRATFLAASNDTAICAGECAFLQPRALTTDLRSTATYKLDRVSYTPFPYSGSMQIPFTLDDVWSHVIPLPFEFCFFGKKYNKCVVGANGNLSFNTALAYGAQPYVVRPAPHATANYNNCVMGAYYDLDPSKGGQVSYETYGTAPCRAFVVSWTDIPLYKCNTLKGTQQIVLYESTNTIDVYIESRPICSIWEEGKGVLGIQNEDGSAAYTFPGRNAAAWADKHAGYRFLASGQPDRSFRWYDLGSGTLLTTTDTVTVCPSTTTLYVLEATLSTQCDVLTVQDTVLVTVNKNPSTAAFDYILRYGCTQDTLLCINHSTFSYPPPGGERFFWDFGDGTTDTARNPVHIYKKQGDYLVTLTTGGNSVCPHTARKQISIRHVLDAGFTVSRDSFCGKGLVKFTDTSIITPVYGKTPTYRWYYNDGSMDTGIADPAHLFQEPGQYLVMQVVGNGIPCYDSSFRFIIVDSIPYLDFAMSDTVICAGDKLQLSADYLKEGFRSLLWDFGDGSIIRDRAKLDYTYERSGYFTIRLKATYRLCPDISTEKQIHIKEAPVAFLGRDTTMCPGGTARYIQDLGNYQEDKTVSRKWNTGDTTAGITVRTTGTYILSVDVDGCKSSDTIVISQGCYINVPNAFSPNGDGENDHFLPLELSSKDVVSYDLQIFNRWGQLLFVSRNNDSKGWDGKYHGVNQPFGVYVYTLKVSFANGVQEAYEGNLTLIR